MGAGKEIIFVLNIYIRFSVNQLLILLSNLDFFPFLFNFILFPVFRIFIFLNTPSTIYQPQNCCDIHQVAFFFTLHSINFIFHYFILCICKLLTYPLINAQQIIYFMPISQEQGLIKLSCFFYVFYQQSKIFYKKFNQVKTDKTIKVGKMLMKIQLIFLFSLILSNVSSQIQSLRNQFPNQQSNKTSTLTVKSADTHSTEVKLSSTSLSSSLRTPALRNPLPPIVMTYEQYYQNYKTSPFSELALEQIQMRSKIFEENLKKINEHNSNTSRRYDLGLNQFADQTQKQFEMDYSYNPFIQKVSTSNLFQDQDLPKIKIDWECKSSPVLDQGKCRCGYAMAAISSIETTMKIHNIPVQKLSVQQIISCSKNDMTVGCVGGKAHIVFDYAKQNGIGLDSLYKYEEKTKNQNPPKCNQTIMSNKDYLNSKVFIKDYKKIKQGDCAELIEKLKTRSVVAKVSSKMLKFYEKGSLDTEKYVELDHFVAVVGYNSDDQTFKIKNSWGEEWGNKGYANILKNVGICFKAYYPILEKEQEIVNSECK